MSDFFNVVIGGVIVSEGTLAPAELLYSFATFASDVLQCQDRLIYESFNALVGEESEDVINGLLGEMFNLMEDLAPHDYYFGTIEGDGACFGYFPYESGW